MNAVQMNNFYYNSPERLYFIFIIVYCVFIWCSERIKYDLIKTINNLAN